VGACHVGVEQSVGTGCPCTMAHTTVACIRRRRYGVTAVTAIDGAAPVLYPRVLRRQSVRGSLPRVNAPPRLDGLFFCCRYTCHQRSANGAAMR